ncbi:MAG TPA: hypothetical protein VNK50_13085 [Calidithermus sp.]|nr:hypothetical protein [Calidithermus sp.]
MALVTIPGALVIPDNYWPQVSAPTTTSVTLSAGTHRAAMIVRVPRAGTLDGFEWMCAFHTLSGATVRHSFQDVDLSTGNPDGVVDQFRTFLPTSGAWVNPGALTADGTDGGAKRTVARGDLLACVIDFTAFGSGSGQLVVRSLGIASSAVNQWVATFNGTSWTKNAQQAPILALRYSDGTYAVFQDWVWPLQALNTRVINVNSTPDESGLRFQVPFDCELEGVEAWVLAGADCQIVLYGPTDTVLATVALDPDLRQSGSAARYPLLLPAPVALTRNTTYRLVCKPTTTTGVSVYDFTLPGAAYQAALPGGAEWYLTERTDGGAWTDTTTRRPWGLGLRIGRVHDTGGAGGTGGGLRLAGHGGLAA